MGGVEGQRSDSTGSVMRANEVMGDALCYRGECWLGGRRGCGAGWKEAG